MPLQWSVAADSSVVADGAYPSRFDFGRGGRESTEDPTELESPRTRTSKIATEWSQRSLGFARDDKRLE